MNKDGTICYETAKYFRQEGLRVIEIQYFWGEEWRFIVEEV